MRTIYFKEMNIFLQYLQLKPKIVFEIMRTLE